MQYDPENIDCMLHIAKLSETREDYTESYSFFKKAASLNTQNKEAAAGQERLRKLMIEKDI